MKGQVLQAPEEALDEFLDRPLFAEEREDLHVQMIAWRAFAESHSLNTTVSRMLIRIKVT